ncbi:autotransporter assembly complex protein TamA [Nitratidesulfovibrio sp. SRB-5]|uniref:autotransporter assembly complex protein TamA n=1 Tax=Nitratidesulfovibrio sp. SRB-5 TaxID=2872636 RepID=UPI00167E939E|nr:BamA/TamA family outer membrane protein [Nitratidesulfovibrio sp. SRB-5]MBZ2171079.1 BamA/TamA family outer membrane protein [Nitratidesulfovibrio sp. SRB-5]
MPCIRLHAAVARTFSHAPPLPSRRLALALLTTLFLTLAGCAAPRNDVPPTPGTSAPTAVRNAAPSAPEATSALDAVAPPRTPPGLCPSAMADATAAPQPQNTAPGTAPGQPPSQPSKNVAYRVSFIIAPAGSASDGSGPHGDPPRGVLPHDSIPDTPPASRPDPGADDRELLDATRNASLLQRLADTPPESMTGLRRRMLADEQEAVKVLRAHGYYAGTAAGSIDDGASPVAVRLELRPGPRYVVGATHIRIVDGVSSFASEFASAPPRTLAEVGLASGAPAVSDAVLDAVGRVPAALRDTGYPFARVASARYEVDHDARTLDATVDVVAGLPTRMGPPQISGARTVRPEWLESMADWQAGQPWDERTVERYRERLRATGLFSAVSAGVVPAPESATATDAHAAPDAAPDIETALPSDIETALPSGTRTDAAYTSPVRVEVTEGPQRTVGGGLRYDSTLGPGVLAFWEHRNLLGEGERLRLELPVWDKRQEGKASFRKPSFLRPDQELLAESWMRNETSDAYDQQAAFASVGLARDLAPGWRAGVGVSTEGGRIEDAGGPERSYTMWGLPLSLRRDATDDLLDPTRGTRADLSVTPYTGVYDEPFNVVRSRLDVSAYHVLLRGKAHRAGQADRTDRGDRAAASDNGPGGHPDDLAGGYPDGPDGRLVLAASAAAGSLSGASSGAVPGSIRFYGGGGGSVRGYSYQSLGPREDGDPIGGSSFGEASFELRYRISETLGIVPFLDGGNVYEEETPRFGDAMRWGAGIGVRYYTVAGPLRLDVATPLNPREDDAPLQFYISIGQSF